MAKKMLLLCWLGFICFWETQSVAYDQRLHEIHAEIQKKGARWQAGDTIMSRLSFADQQKRLGLFRPVLTGKEPRLSLELAPAVDLPVSLDWRNNGGNFVTPIRDQGSCGSCWAFATSAALESVTLIANQTPGVDLNLSEQVLVSCGNSGSCNGGYISTASEFFKNTGLPPETCYPYTATNGSCSSACANWQSSAYRISGWQYVATHSPTAEGIKNALYQYGPLVTTMAVYQDFFSYRSGVYSYVSGSLAGYHAVLIVGYDDPGQYFIVKNSWGTWWGEAGYFRIAYSELNSVVEFGDWTIAYTGMSPSCSYGVSQPTPSTLPGSGGNGSLTVNAPAGCPWTAASNAPWISITSGASGTGPGTVSFSASANPDSNPRSGSLRVAGQTVTVYQNAGVACTYSLNPGQQSLAASGGAGSVGVTTASGCPWTATSNSTWITVTAGASGNGSGTVVYSVAANAGTSSRSGSITIGGQVFTVSQSGVSCTYSISPNSNSVVATGGAGSVSVTAPGGCGWTAASRATWITVVSGASGSGNGTVNYAVGANTTATPRTGTLTVAGQTFTVNQAGVSCTYGVSPTSISAGASGETGTVNVSTPAGCGWSAVSQASWIVVTSGSSGSGNGTVGYSVAANSSPSPRTGTLLVAGNALTVTQAAGGVVPKITVSPESLKFGTVSLRWSSTKTVTVGNGGTAPLNVQSVNIGGAQASQFRQTHTCSRLNPGETCIVQVTFSPTTTGTKSAVLQIYSDDPAQNPVSIPLSGKSLRFSTVNKNGD